jgi:carboxypeptidase C (cathepsin A)
MALLLSATMAAIPGDKVTSLPGWSSKLPSAQYSGLVNSTRSTFHYWLVESENDPQNAPLVVWMNGGPGASSMFGMMTELGPLTINYDSLKTDPPALFYNPMGWQTVANILAIEQPPPTGFSFCVDPAGDHSSCGNWNDTSAALENYHFLLNWFEKYPEYKDRDLYITGESYGGIYVPELTNNIVKGMKATPGNGLKLKGIAVGDGCSGHDVPGCGGTDGMWWHLQFMYGHGQVSQKMYDQVVSTCTVAALKDGTYKKQPGCVKDLNMFEEALGGYYAYNLYDECEHKGPFYSRTSMGARGRASVSGIAGFDFAEDVTGALNDYKCGGTEALTVWANRSDVRDALHVPATASWNNVDGEWPEYHSTANDLRPYYKEWNADSDLALRILIYSGDADPGVMYLGSEEWTSGMGYTEKEPWRPWTLDGQQRMGGYVTRYTTPSSASGGSFDFLTIRGAGHMVPQMQPAAAIEFFTRWLNDENYKPYVSKAGTAAANVSALPAAESKINNKVRLVALEGHMQSQRLVWAAKEAAMQKEIENLKQQL